MSALENLRKYLAEVVLPKVTLTEFGTLEEKRQQAILAQLKEQESDLVEKLAVVIASAVNHAKAQAPKNPRQREDDDHATYYDERNIFPGDSGSKTITNK